MSESSPYLTGSAISAVGKLGDTGTAGDTVFCHEHCVPAELGPEIERLYENIFSSFSHFAAYGGLPSDTCTYVAGNADAISTIFLFRKQGDMVLVLNEGMQLDSKSVQGFANYVFARWPEIARIVFHAVRTRFPAIPYAIQRHECTAQVALPLPSTEQAYFESLGKNMRRNIRRYLKALVADYPSFRFEVYGPEDVSDDHLRAIFNLSRLRITGLNKSFALDEEAEKIFALAKLAGCTGVATIDGKVVGGMIGFRTGGTYFAKVLGHDPAYKDFSLGILCCYLMIKECIARGFTEFNFMWNEYPYKAALGGKRLALERLVIYRSPLHLLRHSRFAAQIAFSAWRYRLGTLPERANMQESLSKWERAQVKSLLWIRKCRDVLRAKERI